MSGVSSSCARGVIEYAITDSGQGIAFTDDVIARLLRHSQFDQDTPEVGGQLFARIDRWGVRIEHATGPRTSDVRRLRACIPNRAAERQEIQRLFKEGLHYVGDWHTHPERYPTPSAVDISSVQDMFRRSKHRLASFVVVIVGTAPLPDGLFVGIANENGWSRLSFRSHN